MRGLSWSISYSIIKCPPPLNAVSLNLDEELQKNKAYSVLRIIPPPRATTAWFPSLVTSETGSWNAISGFRRLTTIDGAAYLRLSPYQRWLSKSMRRSKPTELQLALTAEQTTPGIVCVREHRADSLRNMRAHAICARAANSRH
jgi:hypothetical protein